jgi:hypothetical protein
MSKQIVRPRLAGRWVAAGLAALLAACASDTDSTKETYTTTTTDTETTDTETTPTTAPWTITVTANDLAGYSGKILLAFAAPPASPISGAVCAPLTTDPASVSAPIAAILADPCTLGDPLEFAAGTYEVSAGIYTGGSKLPDACADTVVTEVVDGPVEVVLGAFGACN